MHPSTWEFSPFSGSFRRVGKYIKELPVEDCKLLATESSQGLQPALLTSSILKAVGTQEVPAAEPTTHHFDHDVKEKLVGKVLYVKLLKRLGHVCFVPDRI